MNRHITATLTLLLAISQCTVAQPALTLEKCRMLALENNKKLRIAEAEKIAAHHERRAASTSYLPRIDANALYMHNSHKTVLLDSDSRRFLENIGSSLGEEIKEIATIFPAIQQLAQSGFVTSLDRLGSSISDALTLDTRNIFAGTISAIQPIYAGGKISAYNRLTVIAEKISHYNYEATKQDILLTTEEAYWQVVSLSYKEQLATSYLKLTQSFLDDAKKIERQGMATKAELLSINVKVNEAGMAHLEVKNGLALARILLNHICGLPLDSTVVLYDETEFTVEPAVTIRNATIENRPELYALESVRDATYQQTRIVRSDFLPTIILTGGYAISNPSITDGFRRKFEGTWNIGVVLKIPVWNWGEGYDKIKASKARSTIAIYTLDNVHQEMQMQLQQQLKKVSETNGRLALAESNIKMAEENLRNTNLSFNEGMATVQEVMEAQTAWIKAHSSLIDAKIDIMLSQARLKRATGTLE